MVIPVHKLKFSRHLSATHADDIRSFILPIINKFGFKHFSYTRMYPENKSYCLTVDPEFSELYIAQKLYQDAFCGPIQAYVSGYYLWEHFVLGTKVGTAIQEHSGINSGVTIINNKAFEYCEFHCFATTLKSPFINHFLINNRELFNSIIKLFCEKFSTLIERANKNRVIIPKVNCETIFTKFSDQQMVPQTSPLTFSQQFTQREIECLRFLAKAVSTKEIAYELRLSPRTVEKYIMSLRQKTKSRTSKRLIARLSSELYSL